MQQIQFIELPSQRKFGVELEVSNEQSKKFIASVLRQSSKKHGYSRFTRVTPQTLGWAETNNNDYWHVKYDSTCGPLGKYKDYGWEVASFIGMSFDDIKEIGQAAEALKQSGIQTNHNCGFHIHVDVSDFCPWQMGVLLLRWLKIENVLFSICHPTRHRNDYCKSLWFHKMMPLARHAKNFKDFWNLLAPSNLGSHENDEKKFTLNTVGYARGLQNSSYSRKTVELRMPECLLDYEHVANWIKLYLNFVEAAKSAITSEELEPVDNLSDALCYLGLANKKDFFILNENLHETKLWLLKKLKKTKMRSEANKHLEFIGKI